MHAQFRLWELEWSQARGWIENEVELKPKSVLLKTIGSGHQVVTAWESKWSGQLGPTSRGIYGAFCDAILSSSDPNTGGPPQLAGIYREGPAHHIGVIHQSKRYLQGMEVPEDGVLRSVEWRNDLFELCDGTTMQRLPTAQRQPKPCVRLAPTLAS
jgi:hypothetical protein